MHIEIQNCFSFWGTSSPDPHRGFAPGPHRGTSVTQTPAQDVPHILYQVYAPAKPMVPMEAGTPMVCSFLVWSVCDQQI